MCTRVQGMVQNQSWPEPVGLAQSRHEKVFLAAVVGDGAEAAGQVDPWLGLHWKAPADLATAPPPTDQRNIHGRPGLPGHSY